jgi:hypothetical protein
LGYTELRFTNEELLVNPDGVIAKIKAVAEKLPSFKGRTEVRPVLRGVCVGYVTRERNAIKQLFTRRAIINGGPALANDATGEEVQALMEAVRKELNGGPIYIETRNFNDYSPWKEAFEQAGFAYKRHLNFHIDCTDQAAMWGRLSERRRREIRKVSATASLNDAARLPNEPQAGFLSDERDIRAWYAILEKLYRTKVKTPLWPLKFFIEAHRQGVARYLLVRHEGKVIGGIMVVSDEMSAAEPLNDAAKLPNAACGTVYEWYICGLDADYKDQYPSVMATWAAMEYANTHGLARFDVMGAGEPGVPYGVRDFKAEFGGELVEQGRFIHIAKPLLYKIGETGVRLLKKISI